jgi:hypothetical protein
MQGIYIIFLRIIIIIVVVVVVVVVVVREDIYEFVRLPDDGRVGGWNCVVLSL